MENDEYKILVVDDNSKNIQVIANLLSEKGYIVDYALNGQDALQLIALRNFDLILLDIMMPGMDGFEVCRRIKKDKNINEIPIIFLTAKTDIESIQKAFKTGGLDYVTKPFNDSEVLVRVKTHLMLRKMQKDMEGLVKKRTEELEQVQMQLRDSFEEVKNLKDQLQEEIIVMKEEIKLFHDFEHIIGQSKPLLAAFNEVEKVAKTNATVLITGKTGTGKELFARSIHNLSNRKNKALIKIDCATLPAHLIESELFGHERGAFTGALMTKKGKFEIANGSTVFLDEIGELPSEMQVKLLRVLQDGEFEHLGGTKIIRVDVRIIAATNRNLEKMVSEQKFRADLFYRLNSFPIHVPSLAERKDDIPLLIDHFLNKLGKKIGKKVIGISKDSTIRLKKYPWPGNIRELENIIERAIISSKGSIVKVDKHWIPEIVAVDEEEEIKTLEEIEKIHILKVLKEKSWRISGESGAASSLGLNPSTLRSKMIKLDIKKSVSYT